MNTDTETVTVHQKGEDFEIIVQHDQSGSAYGIPLSKNAYEQLRQHFVSGSVADYVGRNCPFCGEPCVECSHKATYNVAPMFRK